MTIKEQPNQQPVPAKAQRGKRILIFTIIFVVLLALAGAGFAAGVYLKLIDFPKLTEQMNLQDYPVIGKYFNKPKTNFETVDTLPEEGKQPTQDAPAAQVPTPQQVNQLPPVSAANPNDAAAAKQLQQEYAKTISKLARLYGGMKPEEAVAILNQMDDNTVIAIISKMDDDQVSRIMALFDPKRAARLSQSMLLKGKPPQ
jgi:hypothetical protein